MRSAGEAPRWGAAVLFMMAALTAGWAPAPLPKRPPRIPPVQMAGAWDVDWDGSGARIDLRPDGSARFAYTSGGGTYDGRWQYHEGKRQVALTLQVIGKTRLYEMSFDKVSSSAAEGKVHQGSSMPWPVKMVRAK